MADRALEGLRVVEFTDEIASYCGRLLADLGADVVKIEPPGGGRQRNTPPYIAQLGEGPDSSLAFWVHNTSKKSVVLDLEFGPDREQARQLCLSADVVLEDYPVGYLSSRGLGFEALHSFNPSLVYTSVTGFGQTGPHANYAYSDIVGQAMGGVMTLAGEMADPPNMIYGNQANISASIHAAQGTLMAVLQSDATGQGQAVDVSVQEAMSMNQETAMQTWDLQKRNRVRTGELGFMPLQVPGTGVVKCSDGEFALLFVLAPAGKDMPELINWMREEGKHEDLDDEPYASVLNQLNFGLITRAMTDPAVAAELTPNLGHIQAVIERFFASMTAREAYEGGQGRQLLVGLVSTPKALAENTQLRARDWFVKIPLEGGAIEFPGGPYRLSETPVRIGRPPRLGEHTVEVLGALNKGGPR
jgi:benzylsuccinate CoA-transferase BbsE subunit